MVPVSSILGPSGWLLGFYGLGRRIGCTSVMMTSQGLKEGFFEVLFTKKMFCGVKHIIKSVVLAKPS